MDELCLNLICHILKIESPESILKELRKNKALEKTFEVEFTDVLVLQQTNVSETDNNSTCGIHTVKNLWVVFTFSEEELNDKLNDVKYYESFRSNFYLSNPRDGIEDPFSEIPYLIFSNPNSDNVKKKNEFLDKCVFIYTQMVDEKISIQKSEVDKIVNFYMGPNGSKLYVFFGDNGVDSQGHAIACVLVKNDDNLDATVYNSLGSNQKLKTDLKKFFKTPLSNMIKEDVGKKLGYTMRQFNNKWKDLEEFKQQVLSRFGFNEEKWNKEYEKFKK